MTFCTVAGVILLQLLHSYSISGNFDSVTILLFSGSQLISLAATHWKAQPKSLLYPNKHVMNLKSPSFKYCHIVCYIILCVCKDWGFTIIYYKDFKDLPKLLYIFLVIMITCASVLISNVQIWSTLLMFRMCFKVYFVLQSYIL